MPRVSIALPVYNGERYIEQSIRSVLEQTYTDLELVVSDNASTDRTIEIVERFAATDPRVVLLRNEENRGAAWNYNNAFEHSTGELFRWHAHDDWFEPELIESLVAALDADADVVLAHSWTRFVDDDGETLREFQDDLGVTSTSPAARLRSVVRQLRYCNAVFGLVRRDVLATTALIGSFPGSDVSLLNELAVRGRFAVVPAPTYVRRPGASIKANPSTRAVADWFGPDATGRRFPGLKQAAATIGAVWRAPLPIAQRALAMASFVAVWPRAYGGRLKRRTRRRARES